MDEFSPPTPEIRSAALEVLTDWLGGLEADPDFATMIAAVVADEETERDRWFVRVNGDAKDVYSVWFELDQRTLSYEVYVMPSPEDNGAAFYEQLLVRNDRLRDVTFTIGDEQAIYLKGRAELGHVTAEMLDRVLGTIHAVIEQSFVALLRLGFANRFPAS